MLVCMCRPGYRVLQSTNFPLQLNPRSRAVIVIPTVFMLCCSVCTVGVLLVHRRTSVSHPPCIHTHASCILCTSATQLSRTLHYSPTSPPIIITQYSHSITILDPLLNSSVRIIHFNLNNYMFIY